MAKDKALYELMTYALHQIVTLRYKVAATQMVLRRDFDDRFVSEVEEVVRMLGSSREAKECREAIDSLDSLEMLEVLRRYEGTVQ